MFDKVKTEVEKEVVLKFLEKKFGENIVELTPIKGGELSQAFSFRTKSQELIMRVSKNRLTFDKDIFAYKYFSSSKIVIPKILEVGKLGKLFYAISEKAKGKHIEDNDLVIQKKLLPQMIDVLDAIHKTDISFTQGYGNWNKDGKAPHKSWKEAIMSFIEDNERWVKIYKIRFVKQEIITKILKRMRSLLPNLIDIRSLVNGDFGFSNLITDGEKITAVIDWGESAYGDFLYDIAWLDFWHKEIKYPKEFENFYKSQGRIIKNMNERLLFCSLSIGVGSLGFFARIGRERDYHWTEKRIEELL